MKGLIEVKNNVLKKGIHYVTSDYKTRNTSRPSHNGMDMVSYNGKNTTTDYIICVYDGEVVKNEYSALGGGYWVEVKHTNNISSRYLHMKKDSIQVKVGEKIKKGQKIMIKSTLKTIKKISYLINPANTCFLPSALKTIIDVTSGVMELGKSILKLDTSIFSVPY